MIAELLHAKTGPLTRELLRVPGQFGLGQLPVATQPDSVVKSVCGYCSTGCSLDLHVRDGQALNLSPTTEYPVNLGMACPKGWEALSVLDAPDRAATPLLRNAHGKLAPVSWETALYEFTQRFKAIQSQYGPAAVAFLSTGQMPTEEMAFLGALAKFGMGILHGDGNTRQCMATSVVAYKQSFGFDAPPYTYADFEESDVIVLIGSNLCLAHPILWERVMGNKHSPEIIVIDPRMTETAANATQHLRVYPKGDQSLLYGVARILIEQGWIDRGYIDRHTTGFDQFAAFVRDYPIERVVRDTGITADAIHRFAETIHQGKRVSLWWTMGVNQSYQGVRTAQAIINLALMTGNMGRPGTGANSITGQCNAMGSRLFSNTTNLLGGHDFANADHRAKVSGILGIDESRIPREASWPYPEIMEGILRGKIKGLWVVCTNTAHSWINQHQAREILDRLDFLVVQDMYHSTETAQMAHLVLPAAGWGEKSGTFINSERRIGVIHPVRRAPGQALSDFRIFRAVAHAWGCGEMFAKWTSPEAVFALLQQLSRGQPCDITGIEGYGELEQRGGVQWPWPAVVGTSRGAGEQRSRGEGAMSRGEAIDSPSKGAEEQRSGGAEVMGRGDAGDEVSRGAEEQASRGAESIVADRGSGGSSRPGNAATTELPIPSAPLLLCPSASLPSGDVPPEHPIPTAPLLPCSSAAITVSNVCVHEPPPADNSAPARERRLFTDGRYYHPDGRAKFLFDAPKPLSEPPSAEYPLILLTGRGSASQWHTQTRTSKSAVLRKLYPTIPFVEINPRDARERGIVAEDWVTVRSQRGAMQAKAVLTHNVLAGQVFLPMHDAGTNQLTDAVFDPYSKQPSYKACAVQVVAGRT